MSQFGDDPFGTDSGFGGPGLFSITGVVALASNEILVVFDVAPRADDQAGFVSAINPSNWTLTPFDPTIESTTVPDLVFVPKGAVVPTITPLLVAGRVDEDTDKQIHLITDTEMEPGVQYDLEIQPAVVGDQCEVFSGPTSWRFTALRAGPARRARFVQEDRYRDWANIMFPTDPSQPEGTWTITSTTDIALHDGDAALKKRILRRILAVPGDYPHMPGYGAGIRVKALAKTGQMQRLANSVAEQCRLEPDVLDAAATAQIVQIPGGTVVRLDVFVRRREARDSRFVFEFPSA